MIFDSSFLIAFFHETDSLHQKALVDMKKYEEEKQAFLINEHVLGETATVLLYYGGLQKANAFVEYALGNFEIVSSYDDMRPILDIFKKQKRQISYTDASIIFLSRILHSPVATYDEDMIKEIKSIA